MKVDTPLIRRFGRRIGRPAPLVTLAILLASPAVLARQATTAEDLARQAAIVADMEQVPFRIGSWVGVKAEIPTDQTEILNPNAILSRHYSEVSVPATFTPGDKPRTAQSDQNRVGTEVTMLLVHCSDVRDMDGHWPLHCYPRSGWKLDSYNGDVFVPSPEGLNHRFAWARFTIANSGASLRSMTVLFTFILPEGRVETEMAKVADRSSRKSDSAKGVAQFQFVFSGDVPPERCGVVAEQLIKGVPATLRSRLGMPMGPSAGDPADAAPAGTASAKKERGDGSVER